MALLKTSLSGRLVVGERLLTDIVADYALHEPGKPLALVPASSSAERWHTVTYHEFQTAVNSLAWFIQGHCEKSGNGGAIGYMGAHDIRYHVFWLAAILCGYAVSFASDSDSIIKQR